MKNAKFLKKASVVALSAVMACGTAAAFAGCGGGGADYDLSVYIFCSDIDKVTNTKICDDWAKSYTQELRAAGEIDEKTEITVTFNSISNDATYFGNLMKQMSSGKAADIIYVSPKYVKNWAKQGRILDLTEYLTESEDKLADVWSDSLGFYGNAIDTSAAYTQGETLKYDATSKTFKTTSGVTCGLYGLPKDYSNFGLGFNNIYFSEAMRTALTTTKATTEREVKGAKYDTEKLTFLGGSDEEGVVTVDGDDAPLINIGVPTTYKPYNFYKFPSYQEAVNGNDPMAKMVEEFTDGKGYTVTIPGWPGQEFRMPSTVNVDEDAPYDQEVGYYTYTYAEYSALTWAVTYYCNTFAWQGSDPTEGTAGFKDSLGAPHNVYGNDQYDGVLYLLPWLAGNNATYINKASDNVINPTYDGTAIENYQVGNASEKYSQLQLDGTYKDEDVQYGPNSEAFIDTYTAFLAYGSDWNGNSNNAGDYADAKESGWDMFCSGYCVFYGVGTWNAADLNKTDRAFLEYKLCPEPVSEDYALYSEVKAANYQLKEYGEYKAEFSEDEIIANQVARQAAWGARMDSVGYGVNNTKAQKYKGTANEWKIKAAARLVMEFTIDYKAQKSLTYAGAQLPNFVSQTNDFLNYNKAGYEKGSFNDMKTPEGDAKGNDVWASYYALAKKMVANADNGTTVQQFLATEKITVAGSETKLDVVYDKDFNSLTMNKVDTLGVAMKILCMSNYTRADRDLSIRMQTGLNAVRDSAMYTYSNSWLGELEGRAVSYLMAYRVQAPIAQGVSLADEIKTTYDGTESSFTMATPKVFCLIQTKATQDALRTVMAQEQADAQ